MRDLCGAGRRRSLRQDGPQRHRVRHHAADRGSLRPVAPRAGADGHGDGTRLRAVEPRSIGVLSDRPHRAGADGARCRDRPPAGRSDSRSGGTEGHRQVDGAGCPRFRCAGADHRSRHRRTRAVEHEGRKGRRQRAAAEGRPASDPRRSTAVGGDRPRRAPRRYHLRLRAGHGAAASRIDSTRMGGRSTRDRAHLEGRLHHSRASARSHHAGLRARPRVAQPAARR